jgi:hypothetical protein
MQVQSTPYCEMYAPVTDPLIAECLTLKVALVLCLPRTHIHTLRMSLSRMYITFITLRRTLDTLLKSSLYAVELPQR